MHTENKQILAAIQLTTIICGLFVAFQPALALTEQEIQDQIQKKRDEVARLQEEAANLQKTIDASQSQVNTLEAEVSLIDQQIAETTFQVRSKQSEIDALNLEMAAIQHSIDTKTNSMNEHRASLTDVIKRIDQNSRTSTLALLLKSGTFDEFFSQAEATSALSNSLRDGISSLDAARDELEAKQEELSSTKDTLQQSLLELQVKKQSVEQQRTFKDTLLEQVKSTQGSYQDQLNEAAQEKAQAGAAINALETQLRDGGIDETLFSSTGFVWPLKALRGISTYFHDPTYPFRSIIGEHTGLDIPAPQGTPVKATADGIVSVVNNQGFVRDTAGRVIRSALNYVGIIHEGGISSRYLHLSAIYIRPDQFVQQGDIIGLSGGLPGTSGAGTTTTGAHLHFEIRSGGIPDDPLRYLP